MQPAMKGSYSMGASTVLTGTSQGAADQILESQAVPRHPTRLCAGKPAKTRTPNLLVDCAFPLPRGSSRHRRRRAGSHQAVVSSQLQPVHHSSLVTFASGEGVLLLPLGERCLTPL